MNSLASISLLLIVSLAACAPRKETHEAPTNNLQKLSQGLNERNGFKQDEKGNWQPKIDKRSSFESKGESPYFKGSVDKKTYDTNTYAKRSWWGMKSVERKPYNLSESQSRDWNKKADIPGSKTDIAKPYSQLPKDYQTGDYATKDARESSAPEIGKPTKAQDDIDRKSFPQPDVIDFEQQRSISLEQSKKMLGH